MSELIHRVGTMGWLVLGGGIQALSSEAEPLIQHLLSQTDLSRRSVIFHLPREGDVESNFFDDLAAIFGERPEDFDISLLSIEELQAIWLEASLIILLNGPSKAWLELLRKNVFPEDPEEIIAPGSILLALGGAAAVMGEWMLDERGQFIGGFSWLPRAAVLPGEHAPGTRENVRMLLSEYPGSYALGLPESALFAIGPNQEVEVWSAIPPVVSLGYSMPDEE